MMQYKYVHIGINTLQGDYNGKNNKKEKREKLKLINFLAEFLKACKDIHKCQFGNLGGLFNKFTFQS